LRELLPASCRLLVTCPEGLAPVWQAAPWIDEVIPFPGSRVSGSAAARIRAAEAGVGVVLPNSFGSAWDLFRKGIGIRVGRAGRFRRLLLTHALSKWTSASRSTGCHQISDLLAIIAALGTVPWTAEHPPLQPDALPHAGTPAVFDGTDGAWLALAPGAAYGPAKRWPADRFRAVAEWWTGRGGRVVTLGTDADRGLGAEIVTGLSGAVNLAGGTTLTELLCLLPAARCVVANDSGTMHLAGALGVSGVAVVGSTDPVATGPLGGDWIVLHKQLSCAPCFRRECPRSTDDPYACLLAIAADEVCEAVAVLTQV